MRLLLCSISFRVDLSIVINLTIVFGRATIRKSRTINPTASVDKESCQWEADCSPVLTITAMSKLSPCSTLVAFIALCLVPTAVAASELFNPDAPSSNVVIRINAGGSKYVDQMGQQWVSDRYFTAGGTRGKFIGKVRLNGDDKVLKTYRWALHFLGSSNVDYEIPVSPNREYSVELLLPANPPSLIDQFFRRKQEVDIWVQGKRPYDNLKIEPTSMGGFMRVQTKGYLVDETGLLKIHVVSFNAAPAIAGLVVYDVSPAPTSPPTDSPVTKPTDAPVVLPTGAPIVSPTDSPIVSPTGSPIRVPTDGPEMSSTIAPVSSTMSPSYDLVMRLNSGSFAYVDPVTGTSWSNDQYVDVLGNFTVQESVPIIGADDQSVYRSERSDSIGFSYAIPVPSGSLKVVLHFAEIFWTMEDARVFDVSIEGTLVLTDLDIFKVAMGRYTKLVFEYIVQVDDGVLDIDFTSKKDAAKVSGVEVYVQV